MPRSVPGPLRPDRAFLVQLRPESEGRPRLSGRVEHVVSGASQQFRSVAGLLEFMQRHAPASKSPNPPTRASKDDAD